jgi:hypothetical protein
MLYISFPKCVIKLLLFWPLRLSLYSTTYQIPTQYHLHYQKDYVDPQGWDSPTLKLFYPFLWLTEFLIRKVLFKKHYSIILLLVNLNPGKQISILWKSYWHLFSTLIRSIFNEIIFFWILITNHLDKIYLNNSTKYSKSHFNTKTPNKTFELVD